MIKIVFKLSKKYLFQVHFCVRVRTLGSGRTVTVLVALGGETWMNQTWVNWYQPTLFSLTVFFSFRPHALSNDLLWATTCVRVTHSMWRMTHFIIHFDQWFSTSPVLNWRLKNENKISKAKAYRQNQWIAQTHVFMLPQYFRCSW